MKRYLIFPVIFFCLFHSLLLGQGFERKKANLPEIGEVITLLTEATGWALQDNGIWIQSNNAIPNSNADMNRTNDPENKLGRHNFVEMQIREVIVNGEQHMILLVFSKGGAFEFQTLRQGWKPQDDVQYYVFKASKLKQLLPDTLSMGRTHLLNMEILCMDKILNYDRNSYLQKIGNHILRQTVLKHHSPFNLLMAVQPVSLGAGKMVRFRMIEVFNKKGIYNKYFLQDNLPYLLDRFYYEVPFGQFVSFFRMVPVYDALIANPQTFMEYYKRGVVFYDRGNFRAAIADFEKAKSLSALNDVFLVHSYLGNSYFELESFEEALKNYDRAVENRPDDRELLTDWARTLYNRGLTRYKLRDRSYACDDWHKASLYGIEEADKKIRKHCKK